MEQKYDVFISYARKDYVDDKDKVIPGNKISKIKDLLTKNGITYWFDEEGIYLKSTGINLSFLKEIFEMPENLVPSGECDIFAKIYGNYRNPDVYVDCKINDIKLGKTPLGDLTWEMTSEEKEVETEFLGKNEVSVPELIPEYFEPNIYFLF